MTEEPMIRWCILDDIQGAPRNPKGHDIPTIRASIDRHGFVDLPVVDDRTGRLVAGHGRIETLRLMKEEGVGPPAGVRQDEHGRWLVPLRAGKSFPSDSEAEAYLLAANKIPERGGWENEDVLGEMLQDQLNTEALEGLGWSGEEIEALLDTGAPPADPPAPPVQENAISRTGDLWLLGDHRLLCGDATKAEDVERVMGEEKAVLMVTDPPYGIDYDPQAPYDAANSVHGSQGQTKFGKIENDDLDGQELQQFLEATIRTARPYLADDTAFYLWHPMLTQGTFFAAAAADILIHRQIIWVKPHFIFGRGDYHWKHELCFYGWMRGHRPPFYGPRNQDTVWLLDAQRGKDHPAQKPVELFCIPMRNHTTPGAVCYEPFCGSGSQLLAAQQLDRRAFCIDISEHYIDVAVRRWQQFTGQEAMLENTGRTFAQTEEERRE